MCLDLLKVDKVIENDLNISQWTYTFLSQSIGFSLKYNITNMENLRVQVSRLGGIRFSSKLEK